MQEIWFPSASQCNESVLETLHCQVGFSLVKYQLLPLLSSQCCTVHTIVIESVLHTLQCTGTCFGPTTFQMPMSSPIFLQTMNHVEIMENKRSSLVVLLCKQWCHWQVSQCFVLNHCNVTAHFTWCKMHDTTICYMLMGLWLQKDWKMGSNCNRYKNGTLI